MRVRAKVSLDSGETQKLKLIEFAGVGYEENVKDHTKVWDLQTARWTRQRTELDLS